VAWRKAGTGTNVQERVNKGADSGRILGLRLVERVVPAVGGRAASWAPVRKLPLGMPLEGSEGTSRVERDRCDRREALLEAAIELLAEGGARAVTHRAVARRAGLPLASTTYYFASIQELTKEALRKHVTDRIEEFRFLVAEIATGHSRAEIGRLLARAVLLRQQLVTVAQYEVYLEATRDHELRAAVGQAIGSFEALAEAALSILGMKDAHRAAPAFVALMDGYAIHTMARARDFEMEVEELYLALSRLFIGFELPASEIRRWEEWLDEPVGPTREELQRLAGPRAVAR
jgi:DNA-binding transcriptional regulator YbjK